VTDWTPLRRFAECFVDERISEEADAAARALFAYNRSRLIDQVELVLLRRAVAGQEQQDQKTVVPLKRTNGNGRVQ
jgi:hypothetical protein